MKIKKQIFEDSALDAYSLQTIKGGGGDEEDAASDIGTSVGEAADQSSSTVTNNSASDTGGRYRGAMGHF